MSNTPLIYVDLIEDKPMTMEEFIASGNVVTNELYRRYLDRFQPWRLLIKSGDNQEPLFKSTECYFNKADAVHAAEIAFGSSSNVYLRQSEHGNTMLRLANNPDGPDDAADEPEPGSIA
jgi:hypothetical protein